MRHADARITLEAYTHVIHPSKTLSRYKHVDEYGPWRDRDISWPSAGGPRYDVLHPKTHKPRKVPEAGCRFATPEAMQRQIDLNLVEFRRTHTERPFRKAHLKPLRRIGGGIERRS